MGELLISDEVADLPTPKFGTAEQDVRTVAGVLPGPSAPPDAGAPVPPRVSVMVDECIVAVHHPQPELEVRRAARGVTETLEEAMRGPAPTRIGGVTGA